MTYAEMKTLPARLAELREANADLRALLNRAIAHVPHSLRRSILAELNRAPHKSDQQAWARWPTAD